MENSESKHAKIYYFIKIWEKNNHHEYDEESRKEEFMHYFFKDNQKFLDMKKVDDAYNEYPSGVDIDQLYDDMCDIIEEESTAGILRMKRDDISNEDKETVKELLDEFNYAVWNLNSFCVQGLGLTYSYEDYSIVEFEKYCYTQLKKLSMQKYLEEKEEDEIMVKPACTFTT